jgi:conjugative transfer signal peptidase TraF
MKLGLFEILRRPAVLACSAIAVPFIVFGIGDIRINTSPSLPVGLYRVTADQRSPLVEFCPAEPYASVAATRGYRGAGSCPDGGEPLMKPLVAKTGDEVTLSRDGISVNGTLLRNTAPMSTDKRGRPVMSWAFGRHVVTTGEVWVASSYNARSFDSRYFGPVRTADIRCRLKPFIVLP